MIVGVIGAMLLILGSVKVFMWANQEVVARQLAYESQRIGAGDDTLTDWYGNARSLRVFDEGGAVERGTQGMDHVNFPAATVIAESDCPPNAVVVDDLIDCMRQPGGGEPREVGGGDGGGGAGADGRGGGEVGGTDAM